MKKKIALLSLIALFSVATLVTAQDNQQTKTEPAKKECCKQGENKECKKECKKEDKKECKKECKKETKQQTKSNKKTK